ncbi:hypothetical protein [Coleofasciculus sp.]
MNPYSILKWERSLSLRVTTAKYDHRGEQAKWKAVQRLGLNVLELE